MTTPDAQPTAAQPTVPLPDLQAQQPSAPQQAEPVIQPAQQPAPYVAEQPAYRPTTVAGATTLASTNTYALVAILLAFIAPLGAIIFGHLALGQIKRNGDAGRGLALTGTIIGYAYFAAIAVFIFLYVGFIFLMIGSMGAAFSSFDGGYDSYSY